MVTDWKPCRLERKAPVSSLNRGKSILVLDRDIHYSARELVGHLGYWFTR